MRHIIFALAVACLYAVAGVGWFWLIARILEGH